MVKFNNFNRLNAGPTTVIRSSCRPTFTHGPCYTDAVNGGREQREQIVSVAELARVLRRATETSSSGFWVEGEVASLKRAPSGHGYFTLKDEAEDALVECVA